MAYRIERIDDITYEKGRRDVVFISCTDNATVDGWQVFRELKAKNRGEMLGRFELWKRNEQHHNKYFHGFNEIGYRDCFVFKRKEAGTYHRFYGFLFNPRPLTDPGYQLCVLVQHGQKNEENTDPAEMDFANKIRTDGQAVKAIKEAFPEIKGGTNATLHKR
jgi:hypothetical protein